MNKILILLLLSISSLGFGQTSSRWIDMFSYLDIKTIQIADSQVYANAKNAIFTYNINSGEIERTSSVNGITADEIEQIYYHAQLKKLFIVHQGGLIEVIDEQRKVHKSPDLFNNTSIPSDQKKINDVYANNDLLYLATGYGISLYNLKNNEFGDTYYIGDNGTSVKVNSIRIFNNKIFAATDQGLKYADMNDFLLDFNNWHNIDLRHWRFLVIFNNKILSIKGNSVYEINTNSIHQVLSFNDNIIDFKEGANHLNITFQNQVKLFDNNYVLTNTFNASGNYDFKSTTAISNQNTIYIGTKNYGILSAPINSAGYTEIHPDCPLYNHPFDVDAKNGNLWVVYGAHNSYFNPYPLKNYGVSNFKNNTWNNIPYTDLNVKSICSVAIHPTENNTVYLGSAFHGLVKIQDNNISVYDENNSPLEAYIDSNGNISNVRIFKMKFDEKNSLWLTQGFVYGVVKVLKNNGTWQSYNFQDVMPSATSYNGFSSVDFDQNGNFWIGTEKNGALAFDAKTQTKKFLDNNIPFDGNYKYIRALAVDKDGTLWLGAQKGLRILHGPEQIFKNSQVVPKPIKIVYEGVVQLLLAGQDVNNIIVDGSNNKWISTNGNGVYYFSDNGQQTFYHFTKENSPLPSNDIYNIAVDGSTGIVYFATAKGLIGFKGNATEAGENMDDVYAFPNPVNQQKHDFVSIRGLTEKVSVKIVDVEGNLVYETTSKGGSITWDLTAFGKYKVASGVYIALITNEDGSKTQVTKILVIK